MLLQIPGRRKNQGKQQGTDFLGAQTRRAGEALGKWLILSQGSTGGLQAGSFLQPREETFVLAKLFTGAAPH